MSQLREERIRRFRQAGLYLVITREFCAGRSSLDVLRAACDGGIRLVQLREKSLAGKELYELACKVREITAKYDVLMIMNDHTDIALACGADGVHLGQSDMPVEAVRPFCPDLILGQSTHYPDQSVEGEKKGADYVNMGPIYATGTKQTPVTPVGLEFIPELKRRLTIPFTVMGGIKAHHIPQLLEYGAETIAMVTEITQAPDITKRTQELLKLFPGRGNFKSPAKFD